MLNTETPYETRSFSIPPSPITTQASESPTTNKISESPFVMDFFSEQSNLQGKFTPTTDTSTDSSTVQYSIEKPATSKLTLSTQFSTLFIDVAPSPSTLSTPCEYEEKAFEFYEQIQPSIEYGETVHQLEILGAGCFSNVYESKDVCSFVIKLLKPEHLSKSEERIAFASTQYQYLEEMFDGIENPPFVTIYNKDSILEDGFTVVERVTPLETAPWDPDTEIDDFTEDQLKDLERVKMLLWADNALRTGLALPEETAPQERDSPLDLKMDNLGRRGGSLVLLDYVNQRFEECITPTNSVIARASMGNKHVEEHLIQFATEQELTYVLNPIEARDGCYLDYTGQNSVIN